MTDFWEKYLSSGNNDFDIFRLGCLVVALLSFPFIYSKIAILLTLLIILLVGIFVHILLKIFGFNYEESVKASIIAIILIFVLFVFAIFDDILKTLYIICTISFFFIQDWSYRFGHKLFHEDGFNDYIKNNIRNYHNNKHFLFAVVSLLSYTSMFIISCIYACQNFDTQIYEDLRSQKINILTNKNIFEQIFTNEFTIKMEVMNWINAKKQAITSFQKLFGKAGVFFSFIGFLFLFSPIVLGFLEDKIDKSNE